MSANRCTGKPNGNYVVSDVLTYLECKNGTEILHNCPQNQIFVAQKMACSAVTTADEGNCEFSYSLEKCYGLWQFNKAGLHGSQSLHSGYWFIR